MSQPPTTAKPKHVLVVDDNTELAETYKELLQLYGYQVTVANNGVQALKFILDETVDGIVCDLTMPQLEGDMFYAATQRMRPKLCERFIFVTGNAENPKYEDFFRRVKSPVLHKPVAIEKLLAALKGLFGEAGKK
jgi:CheY-like chemotaxis protein